jgi:hypothetical protein
MDLTDRSECIEVPLEKNVAEVRNLLNQLNAFVTSGSDLETHNRWLPGSRHEVLVLLGRTSDV